MGGFFVFVYIKKTRSLYKCIRLWYSSSSSSFLSQRVWNNESHHGDVFGKETPRQRKKGNRQTHIKAACSLIQMRTDVPPPPLSCWNERKKKRKEKLQSGPTGFSFCCALARINKLSRYQMLHEPVNWEPRSLFVPFHLDTQKQSKQPPPTITSLYLLSLTLFQNALMPAPPHICKQTPLAVLLHFHPSVRKGNFSVNFIYQHARIRD